MKDNNFKGIPTTYKGVRFRSRLEAKWACFFDLLEWEWGYEEVECDGWIPDFVIKPSSSILSPVLFEVKPIWTPEENKDYIKWDTDYYTVLLGTAPFVDKSFDSVCIGWHLNGNFYDPIAFKYYKMSDAYIMWGISETVMDWSNKIKTWGGDSHKHFCHDYEYVKRLFAIAQNTVQYKRDGGVS